MLRVDVSKNSSTALSSHEGAFATSTTTRAPVSTSASPSPVTVEKQDHCVGGVEKHCLVRGVFHLNGVIERESAPWASSYASCGRTGSGRNRIVPTIPIVTHATRTTSCATTNGGSD